MYVNIMAFSEMEKTKMPQGDRRQSHIIMVQYTMNKKRQTN